MKKNKLKYAPTMSIKNQIDTKSKNHKKKKTEEEKGDRYVLAPGYSALREPPWGGEQGSETGGLNLYTGGDTSLVKGGMHSYRPAD